MNINNNQADPEQDQDKEMIISETTMPNVMPLLDAGIDCLDKLSEGIPPFKIISALIKTGATINTYVMQAKIIEFINGCGNLSDDDIAKFLNKLESPKKRQAIGTNVIALIEEADSTYQANMIGKCLTLLATDKYDAQFFYRLCHMMRRVYIFDLEYLKYFKSDDEVITSSNRQGVPENVLDELFSCGFLANAGFDGGNSMGEFSGTRFMINEYGKAIRDII